MDKVAWLFAVKKCIWLCNTGKVDIGSVCLQQENEVIFQIMRRSFSLMDVYFSVQNSLMMCWKPHLPTTASTLTLMIGREQ